MSGSFERLSYDQGAYCTDLKQSVAPMMYKLDPTFANVCSPCRPADVGYIGRQGVSLSQDASLIDVESELKLLSYRNTRDPNAKFNPCCGQKFDTNVMHFDDCQIGTDYSRITNPPCTLRGTGWNRFQPLCLDPQDPDRWEHPSHIGINYRMVVKDNFFPQIPDVISPAQVFPDNPDMNPVLPKPGPECLPKVQLGPLSPVTSAYSSPMYTSYYAPNINC